MVLGGGMLTLSTIEQRASERAARLAKAMFLAESGIDQAILALRTDPRYAGSGYTELGNQSGGYLIQVTSDGPSRWIIQSHGVFPQNDPRAFGYTAKAVEVVLETFTRGGPGYGILGNEGVRFNGGGHEVVSIDSYDSRRGLYDHAQARANVRVATNANTDRAMTLVGKIDLKGELVVPAGCDPERILWQTPTTNDALLASVKIANGKVPVEPVELPGLQSLGRLQITGDETVTLEGGVYLFDEIHIAGKGRLEFTGPAEVYVKGDIQISGNGMATASSLPPNLTLYVTGSRVAISGKTRLFAKITAPHAEVDISGESELYGAVSGRHITVHGNCAVHYDEALNLYDEALNPSREGDPFEVNVLMWREVNP